MRRRKEITRKGSFGEGDDGIGISLDLKNVLIVNYKKIIKAKISSCKMKARDL